MNRMFESLMRAYVQCGGDPNTLMEEIMREKPAPMKPEETSFFSKLEDEMKGFNGV